MDKEHKGVKEVEQAVFESVKRINAEVHVLTCRFDRARLAKNGEEISQLLADTSFILSLVMSLRLKLFACVEVESAWELGGVRKVVNEEMSEQANSLRSILYALSGILRVKGGMEKDKLQG